MPPSVAIVVLGYRNAGDRANAVNRFRVRSALRAYDAADGEAFLVFCGGAVGSTVPEAEIMARYARERRGFLGALVLETQSRSTWQNIRNAIPLIQGATRIDIVSNEQHAAVGRAYLREQRPDLAERLVPQRRGRAWARIAVRPVLGVLRLRSRLRRWR